MNSLERKMLELVRRGREHYGVVSVKAEFEAEGTRVDELLRLLDIAGRANLHLTVKIGGCEAIRDLLEAKQFGARFVVAPMIESTYALRKFVSAKDLVFPDNDTWEVDHLFNIETVTGASIAPKLLDIAAEPKGLAGVVFGRSDFVGSLGRLHDAIEDADVIDTVCVIASLVRDRNLDLVVGGGVSIDSLPSLKRIRDTHLSRFETRKVVFDAAAMDLPDISEGLLNAVHFELLWLLNKRDYYGNISREDAKRIDKLEKRWNVLSRDVV